MPNCTHDYPFLLDDIRYPHEENSRIQAVVCSNCGEQMTIWANHDFKKKGKLMWISLEQARKF